MLLFTCKNRRLNKCFILYSSFILLVNLENCTSFVKSTSDLLKSTHKLDYPVGPLKVHEGILQSRDHKL